MIHFHTGPGAKLAALRGAVPAFALWLGLVAGAWAQMPGRDYDHLRSGFALSGAHANARCESCHVGGVLKGTPRDCESCHQSGGRLAKGNVVKTVNHFATVQACDTCHNARSFAGARMNHTGVARGACNTCHNGLQAPGKTAGHVTTTAACDRCHGAAAWLPVLNFDHATIGSATCASCHLVHRPANAVHAGQMVCETCHGSTSTWAGARVDHGSFTAATSCTGCHNGSAASGKNATHIPVGATNCASCHTASTWKPSRFNHTQVPVTAQCASCHSGSYPPADGKPPNHTPYTRVAAAASANCDACHKAGYTAWTPARLHAGVTVTTQCATCHASAKPNTTVHVGQTVCESCHKTTSTWAANVDHATFTAATVCTTCHNGSGATGKNATHIPVGATNCVSCHTTSVWKPSRFNHTQVPVTAQCATCHSGSYAPADGKNTGHIPYALVTGAATANCDTCHRGGYTSWAGGKLHTAVTVAGQCKTCHSGSYASQGAVAKNSGHIPEAQLLNGAAMECNACHTSTTSWSQRMNHNNSMGGGAGWCKGCHDRSTPYSAGMEKKALTHERKTPAAIDCSESGCHRPLGNKGATFSKWD